MSVDFALQLAEPGDLILSEGNYQPTSALDPEAFHEVASRSRSSATAPARRSACSASHNLAAGEEVVLRNLTHRRTAGPGLFFEKLGVRDCVGTVSSRTARSPAFGNSSRRARASRLSTCATATA